MESKQAIRIILPFRHDAPTAVGSLEDLRNVVVERESTDSGSRPYVVYGVPYAGKSTLVNKLRDAGVVVLDTDDVVEDVLGRKVQRFVRRLKDRMLHEPQVLTQQVVDYVLTHPGDGDPLYPWHAGFSDLESVDICKHEAMEEIVALLSSEETYKHWQFTHAEGEAQVVFTNLTTFDWYDAGFFRTPAQAPALCQPRTHRWLTSEGYEYTPAIGPSPETLSEWYARSFRIAERVDTFVLLEEDEWISTA